MTQNQPRLLLRKHSYYIRIFIPRKLQSVVKRKEIRYSLHTNNYFEALKKLRQESAKIDSWLEGLGNNEDDMELKDKKLNLTEEDANSLLLSRLDEIENYFIKQQDRLKIDKPKVLDISLFEEHLGMLKSPKINSNLYKLAILIKNLLRKTSQYLPDDAPEKEIFKNVKQTEIYVELEDINSPYTYGISEYVDFKALVQDKYFLEYLKNCFETEEYIEEKAKAIYKNKEYKSNNLKISNFVNILKQKELLKLEEHKLVKTHWKTVFKNMCSTDKAKTSKNTINKYEQLLNMVFSIIGKDKIEDINFEDCSKFVSLIYKLPPKCKEKYPKLNIETAIQQNEAKNGDCIKIKTVIDHFRIFKELMAYPKAIEIFTIIDDQLYSQFAKCKDFLRQEPIQTESRSHLKKLLSGIKANGIFFTTMQKFEESGEALSKRRNIIVMADEAHRGQYGLSEKIDEKTGKIKIGAARVIRDSLPNATYIGFTGTPISTKDRSTREVFGNYIDVYDMTQAVEDGATRPVYYESRVIKLHLKPEVLRLIDAEYDLMAHNADPEVIEKSKKQLGQMETILGDDSTINSLVTDILDHYENT